MAIYSNRQAQVLPQGLTFVFGSEPAAAAHTERLGYLVAHPPGFVAPTLAARQFATLDQITGGRAAIHVISGGDDTDQFRDGGRLAKEDRYARTDEYVSIIQRIRTGPGPTVDHVCSPPPRTVNVWTNVYGWAPLC